MLAAFCSEMFTACVHAEVPAGWSTNLDATLRQAQLRQQPVLVYYTASWCGPCRRMAAKTFPDETVQSTLRKFSRVALDIDLFGKQSEQRAVEAVPTFLVLTPTGEEVLRLTGFQTAARLVQWLTNALTATQRTIAQAEQAARKLAAANQLLQQADPESVRAAVGELFDLCTAPKAAIQQAAMDQLTDLVNDRPALLLDGLNHPRLATRIVIANLLRSRLGNEFDVDPWETAAHRQQAIARWKAKKL